MKSLALTLTLTAIIQLLYILTPVEADNKSIVIFNDPIEYSQCTNKNGVPVYTSYDHKKIQFASDYAVAGKDKTKAPTLYYIRINYDTFHDAPANVREWVWYHECGHHRLGHTLELSHYASSTQTIIAAEKAADCFATKEFRRHHQESELHLALVWARKTMGFSDIRLKRAKGCE